MRKILSSTAFFLALGASVAVVPVQAQEKQDRQEKQIWNENDRGFWESDNWGTDDFGSYDQDFAWETGDREWESWYGDSDTYWSGYDDIGDEGWLDV